MFRTEEHKMKPKKANEEKTIRTKSWLLYAFPTTKHIKLNARICVAPFAETLKILSFSLTENVFVSFLLFDRAFAHVRLFVAWNFVARRTGSKWSCIDVDHHQTATSTHAHREIIDAISLHSQSEVAASFCTNTINGNDTDDFNYKHTTKRRNETQSNSFSCAYAHTLATYIDQLFVVSHSSAQQ